MVTEAKSENRTADWERRGSMSTHPMWMTVVADRAAAPRPADEPARDLHGPIEKLLLGAVPDDRVESPVAVDGSPHPNHAMTRVTVVRAFLADYPDVRDAIERELYETWARVGRDRAHYLAAVSPLAGQLVSRAELHQVTVASPAAVAELLGALAVYLVQT
jgi:hypothetical protein